MVIVFDMAQMNGAQGLQVFINILENFLVSFTRIAEQFADLELGKVLEKRLKTWDGEQMVIAVGGRAGASDRQE